MLGKKLTAMVLLSFSFASARLEIVPPRLNQLRTSSGDSNDQNDNPSDNSNPFTFGNLNSNEKN